MYEIKEEVLNAVLQYLSSQKYAEVFQLINALQQVKKIEVKKDVQSEEYKK